MNIDSKRIKVLKQLLDSDGRNISELSEASEVPQPTVSRIIEELKEESVVSVSRRGNMKIVKLKKREFVKNLVNSLSGKEELEEAAEKFVEQVKEFSEVKAGIVFGSVARGTADLESDVDILVLVEKENEEIRDRIMINADKISEETGFQISPTIMSVETFEEHKKTKSQFYNSIKDDMETLYDDRPS